jgi:hypothetical protein
VFHNVNIGKPFRNPLAFWLTLRNADLFRLR